MENTQTSTVVTAESASGWRKTDTMWMLGLYGTAIGAAYCSCRSMPASAA